MEQIAIKLEEITKIYKLYSKPIDRLKESLSIKHKKYSEEHFAVHNISFEVKKGEILGILGTNGSGKSTILKIITGVLTPTIGRVHVEGSISALLELGTGFNMDYTGIQNIYLYGTMMNKSKEDMDKELDGIIKFADIGEFIYQPVKTYSSGMFARLAFAVAINVKPEILIVDEILSVGDTRFQIKCMKKMKEMMNDGTTVLFVTHDINAIRRFCTTALWLEKGQVREQGNVDRIADMYEDYLRIDGKENIEIKNIKNENLEAYVDKPGAIVEIKSFQILNNIGNETKYFKPSEKIAIEIIYDVYDLEITAPVIGVAIRAIDDEYICGINTLLDKISIPWKLGRNKLILEYAQGVLALGGDYYFDIAIFDETATIAVQYISKIKEFTVVSEYVGEGKYIPPHTWKGEIHVKI